MVQRVVSPDGINLVIRYEGFRADAYQDTGGVWTIGYGHTKTVRQGDSIDKAEALQLLHQDLSDHVHDLNVLTEHLPLTQSMFDALASLIFEIGYVQFAGSTLLKLLENHQYLAAWAELPKWRYDNHKEILGMARRRADEGLLFLQDGLPKEGK
jgi:lysozyme